jgi:hypothetical protein
VTSAGELEDPVAGEPGALLRRRYLAASTAIRHTGKPACLVIRRVLYTGPHTTALAW